MLPYEKEQDTLEAQGHSFRTNSDTEVLLAAYDAYGPDCVDRLDGMFAFAVWDPRNRTVFLARDRVGKKPLYYSATPDFFAFASEPKALLSVPAIREAADIDPLALSDFLSLGYVLTPKSAFRNIKRLPAFLLQHVLQLLMPNFQLMHIQRQVDQILLL